MDPNILDFQRTSSADGSFFNFFFFGKGGFLGTAGRFLSIILLIHLSTSIHQGIPAREARARTSQTSMITPYDRRVEIRATEAGVGVGVGRGQGAGGSGAGRSEKRLFIITDCDHHHPMGEFFLRKGAGFFHLCINYYIYLLNEQNYF